MRSLYFLKHSLLSCLVLSSLTALSATKSTNSVLQRSIVNTSFEELPDIKNETSFHYFTDPGSCLKKKTDFSGSTNGCVNFKPYDEKEQGSSRTTFYGWRTTDVKGALEIWFGAGPDGNAAPSPGNAESSAGNYYAELNAVSDSFIYQTICFNKGEKIKWSFDHASRKGTETAEFMIEGNGKKQVLGSHTSNLVDGKPVWGTAEGESTFNLETGMYNVGFKATQWYVDNRCNPAASCGNLIDNIRINLAPYVQFAETEKQDDLKIGGTYDLYLLVAGQVLEESEVKIKVTNGGDASAITINDNNPIKIPAGIYDGSKDNNGHPIKVKFRINKYFSKLTIKLLPGDKNPGNIKQTSTSVCGDDRFIEREIEFPFAPEKEASATIRTRQLNK